MSQEESLDLAEYARWHARQSDPEWRTELAKRVDRAAAGQGHSREEVLRLHDRLNDEGK